MTTDTTWQSVRERCESLDPDEVLVTPGDERVFVVERTDADRIVVRFIDGGSQDLRRDQFDVLAESVDDGGLELTSLPPGVGPYVTALSLASQYAVARGGSRSQDTPAGRCGRHSRREPVRPLALGRPPPAGGGPRRRTPRRRLPRTARRRRPRRVAARGPGRPVRPSSRTSSGAPTNSDATSVATCWTRWAPTAVARPVRDGVSNTAGAPHPERRRRGARRTGRGRRPARVGPRRRSGQTRRGAGHDRGRRGRRLRHPRAVLRPEDRHRERCQALAVAGIERQAGRSRKTKRPRSYTRR